MNTTNTEKQELHFVDFGSPYFPKKKCQRFRNLGNRCVYIQKSWRSVVSLELLDQSKHGAAFSWKQFQSQNLQLFRTVFFLRGIKRSVIFLKKIYILGQRGYTLLESAWMCVCVCKYVAQNSQMVPPGGCQYRINGTRLCNFFETTSTFWDILRIWLGLRNYDNS